MYDGCCWTAPLHLLDLQFEADALGCLQTIYKLLQSFRLKLLLFNRKNKRECVTGKKQYMAVLKKRQGMKNDDKLYILYRDG